jgi:N4-gp56 family major capsid protein
MELWSANSTYYESINLSKELRTAVQPNCRFRQFCDVKDPGHQGMHKGATFHWNVYGDITADSGSTSRVLTETATIPNGSHSVTQGTMTIDEYGLQETYHGKLDNLSEQPVKEIIHKVLKRDCVKALDNAAADQFAATVLRVVPTAGTDTSAVTLTTDGTATLTNSIALGKEHVKAIVDEMKERNIPTYTDDDYYCIAWPTTLREFKNDLESVKMYTETGYGEVRRGEIGRYENCRFVEQTNVLKTDMSTAADTWTNAKSNWAVFFGGDTVAEAIAIPEEIRGKISEDYGRSCGIAWYYLGGFGITHTDADQARIVMWDSAA